MRDQGRVRGANFAGVRKFENERLKTNMLAAAILSNIFGSAGGCSLSARIPSWQKIWVVETILVFASRDRTSNLFVRLCVRNILVEEQIRDMMTRFGP